MGFRQGGVLSPIFFYIDNLTVRLSETGASCYIGKFFVGARFYDDDI